MISYIPTAGLGGPELFATTRRGRVGGVQQMGGLLDFIFSGASGASTENAVQNLQAQYDVDQNKRSNQRTAIYVVVGLATAALLGGLVWELAK